MLKQPPRRRPPRPQVTEAATPAVTALATITMVAALAADVFARFHGDVRVGVRQGDKARAGPPAKGEEAASAATTTGTVAASLGKAATAAAERARCGGGGVEASDPADADEEVDGKQRRPLTRRNEPPRLADRPSTAAPSAPALAPPSLQGLDKAAGARKASLPPPGAMPRGACGGGGVRGGTCCFGQLVGMTPAMGDAAAAAVAAPPAVMGDEAAAAAPPGAPKTSAAARSTILSSK